MLKSEMEDRRRDILFKANEDEDKLIKKLEKQLGLNKSKNKNNYFADEGLDCILYTNVNYNYNHYLTLTKISKK